MAVDSAVIQRFHPREGEVGRKGATSKTRKRPNGPTVFPSPRRGSKSERGGITMGGGGDDDKFPSPRRGSRSESLMLA